MKYNLCLLVILSHFILQAQDCRIVSRTSKKNSEIERKGGSVPSKDNFIFLLEKSYDSGNPGDTLNYSATIIMGSMYELKDSIINAEGNFEFYLSNGEILIWNKAKASNLGDVLMTSFPNHIMFIVRGTKKQLEPLTKYHVTKIRAFAILETTFETKSQKQLLTIADCLNKSEDRWD
ncbi:MAG TPA: hypothetical protein VGK59_13105 [Ohtaekwangia sp.]